MKINVICTVDNTKLKHIRDHLEQTDFNFLHDRTVDNAHETFINLLTEITYLHAPIKTIVVHPKKIIINPWTTPALLKSSNTLSKFYRKRLDKPTTHPSYQKYVKYRQIFYKLKRIRKKNYYTEIFYKYKNEQPGVL